MTNLAITTGNKNIPAGILEGVEAFCTKNENGDIEKWLIINRVVIPFEQAPGKIQRMFGKLFILDKTGQQYLQQMGLSAFRESFDQWYFCLFGALDSTPDIVNGQLSPDAFNSACSDHNCRFRGKFCGLQSKLMNYEVSTLSALKQGMSISEAAEALCITDAAVKSRIVVLKEKMGAKNMAMLTANAAQYGI